jgi:DNA-binding transcriptional ArsR family regulator
MAQTAPEHVVRSLAALGHDARLAIFRLLVRAGHEGLNVGEIGAHLGIAPSTLAHHLATLAGSGLVVQERRGRETVNRVDFAALRITLDFLTDECCAGLPASAEHAAMETLP